METTKGTTPTTLAGKSPEEPADDIVCTRCHGGHVRKLLSVFARPRAVTVGDSYDYSDYGDADEGEFGGSCACGGGGCGCHD